MGLQLTSTIPDIKFFDNASACIAHYEQVHWTKKAMSSTQSYGTFLSYYLNKISHAWNNVDAELEPFTHTNTRVLSKKRLVVCVHGLNNKPSQFKTIVDEIRKNDLSETDIFIPYVLQKGNAKLDDMVKPIFQEIAKWSKTSDGKELVMVGISNGARISRAIDADITTLENHSNIKKLKLMSIAGACKGSSSINLANKAGLSSWLMSKNISEEMPTDSERNQRLNRDWINGLFKGPSREYTFFASPHDWLVPNYDSSLMEVNGKCARYAIVPNHGHNSIVNALSVALSVTHLIMASQSICSCPLLAT